MGNMRSYRSLKWLAFAVIAVAITAGYFASRPAATMVALRDAVQAKDTARLQELVDFPALRESVKNKLMSAVAAQGGANPFATMMASALIGPVVDAVISPSGLSLAFAGQSLSEAGKLASQGGSSAEGATTDSQTIVPGPESATTQPPAPAQPQPPEHQQNVEYITHWDSLSKYTVDIRRDGATVAQLILVRDGVFHWRLAGLQ